MITFKNINGDIVFNLKNLAATAGRTSAVWDRGVGAAAIVTKAHICIKYSVAPTYLTGSRLYIVSSNINPFFDIGADAAAAAEQLMINFDAIGSVVCNITPATVGPFYRTADIQIIGRYVMLGLFNFAGQGLVNTDELSYVSIG